MSNDGPLHIVTGGLTGDGPLDTAVARAVLLAVTEGALPETLQLGTPHRVMAFGKHDTLAAGFRDAVATAIDHGYEPTVRIAGGRAVVFSPSIVRFAWTMPARDAAATMHQRFAVLADAVVAALGDLEVASAVGEVPGEYCAGDYSVHVMGTRKVMGVGQRLTRAAAQVGGMVVVDDPDHINDVLVPVYGHLGVPMDPAATGSIADVAAVDTAAVMDALAKRIAGDRPTVDASIDGATLDRAMSLRKDHDPTSAGAAR